MKKSWILFFILYVFIFPLLSEEKLAPEHKEWLKAISPIITKTEKEIFSKLKTKEERDKFIQFFWEQRDPLPDTPENEFYLEYMKRVQFADANFGHETSKKGSQTERGFFYLLLGPPLERHFFTTSSEIWPLELWYYKGELQHGLPPYFYLIFYQPKGLGEYRLYYPDMEGPENLVIPSLYGQTLNRSRAFETIKKISGELANASLSYIPGERTLDLTSFSSSTIISNVYSLPEKKFSDAYARSYLSYKDYVETDYSHNFVESNFTVKVFKNFNHFFIHWALEPKKVNFAVYEDKYYAAYQLILKIEDIQGNTVLERIEDITLKITPEQYKAHERQPFAFQDVLPVIPGNFKLFFLLKNKTAKDFTSFETEISVPREEGGPLLSNLLLYQSQEKIEGGKKQTFRAFAFSGNQYLINTQNHFLPQGEIGLYCQAYNVEERVKDIEASLLLEVYPLDADTSVMRERKALEEVLSPGSEEIDIGPLSLSSLKPGYYQVRLSILDESGHAFLSEKENFIILSQSYPVLPWVYSRLHRPFLDSKQLYILSSQYFLTRKYEKAKDYLEQSLKLKDEPGTRLLLAKTLYALQQYQDSLAVVFPVYQTMKDREAAKIIALNYAGLKDWSSALIYLEELMEQATEVSVLNLAAECYLNLNQPQKALPLLQKSLEINPDQAYIKNLVEKAKKRLEH